MNEGTAGRVLLVDDEPGIRSLLTAICRRLGFRCETAADGAEALDKLREERFDAVVLDLMMPRVNGFEVISALRDMQAAPPIIVLTAAGDKVAGPLADREPVRAVLLKPFDLAQLAKVLAATVGSPASTRT